MKQLIASILLILFLYPALSTYIHYQGGKHRYAKAFKRKMVRGIAKEQCVKIEVKENSQANPPLEWHNSHEFRLNGIMFDIVSSIKTTNGIVYYVIQDIAESKFIAQIEEQLLEVLSHDPGIKKQASQCYSFFHSLFFVEEKEILLKLIYADVSKDKFDWNAHFISNQDMGILLPPPEAFI